MVVFNLAFFKKEKKTLYVSEEDYPQQIKTSGSEVAKEFRDFKLNDCQGNPLPVLEVSFPAGCRKVTKLSSSFSQEVQKIFQVKKCTNS